MLLCPAHADKLFPAGLAESDEAGVEAVGVQSLLHVCCAVVFLLGQTYTHCLVLCMPVTFPAGLVGPVKAGVEAGVRVS
jgi:hypothetical protein